MLQSNIQGEICTQYQVRCLTKTVSSARRGYDHLTVQQVTRRYGIPLLVYQLSPCKKRMASVQRSSFVSPSTRTEESGRLGCRHFELDWPKTRLVHQYFRFCRSFGKPELTALKESCLTISAPCGANQTVNLYSAVTLTHAVV